MKKNVFMLKYVFLYFLTTLLFNAFGQNDSICKKVKDLKNDSLKRIFLEDIFQQDQAVREKWMEAKLLDSVTLQRAINKVGYVDSLNIIKVECYLEHYNYPQKEKLGNTAALTPLVVIHHINQDAKVRNFPVLLQAYNNRNVDEGLFSRYMTRTLAHSTGEDLDFLYTKGINWQIEEMQKEYDRNYSKRKLTNQR